MSNLIDWLDYIENNADMAERGEQRKQGESVRSRSHTHPVLVVCTGIAVVL